MVKKKKKKKQPPDSRTRGPAAPTVLVCYKAPLFRYLTNINASINASAGISSLYY